jgi:hypothetical protein
VATNKIKPKYKQGDVVTIGHGATIEITGVYRAHGVKTFLYSFYNNSRHTNEMVDERHLHEPTDAQLLKWRLTK